jgi:hypothetical protein
MVGTSSRSPPGRPRLATCCLIAFVLPLLRSLLSLPDQVGQADLANLAILLLAPQVEGFLRDMIPREQADSPASHNPFAFRCGSLARPGDSVADIDQSCERRSLGFGGDGDWPRCSLRRRVLLRRLSTFTFLASSRHAIPLLDVIGQKVRTGILALWVSHRRAVPRAVERAAGDATAVPGRDFLHLVRGIKSPGHSHPGHAREPYCPRRSKITSSIGAGRRGAVPTRLR